MSRGVRPRSRRPAVRRRTPTATASPTTSTSVRPRPAQVRTAAPPKDTDGDGITDDLDKCPTEPETKNGFEDADGCPDELPAEVAKFTGAIKGIQFDFGKATIQKGSQKLLDEAADVLMKHVHLRLEISGHTDNVGARDANIKLSEDRANAVKDYLVSKSIDAGRITMRGAGPDEPIAENDSRGPRAEPPHRVQAPPMILRRANRRAAPPPNNPGQPTSLRHLAAPARAPALAPAPAPGPAHAPAPAPAEEQEHVRALTGRLELERYKATVKATDPVRRSPSGDRPQSARDRLD